MSADISGLDELMPDAIRHFWRERKRAADRQQERGTTDQGNRAAVTAGRNMDGFVQLARRLIADNGIPDASVHSGGRKNVTIPGYYRPAKSWDLLVVNEGRLVAAMEFKSQVGPSFGNNFNNRVEEAIGNAIDLNEAFEEGVFGDSPKPFVGYFFVIEECPASATPVEFTSPHFPAMPEFEKASYVKRYEILCRKLVQKRLYDAAGLVLTSRDDVSTGAYRSAGDLTSARRFAATLAGAMAGMAIQ